MAQLNINTLNSKANYFENDSEFYAIWWNESKTIMTPGKDIHHSTGGRVYPGKSHNVEYFAATTKQEIEDKITELGLKFPSENDS